MYIKIVGKIDLILLLQVFENDKNPIRIVKQT